MKRNRLKIKAIIFSHNDLDGAGCVILGKLAFETCAYRINNYANIDEKVVTFVKNETENGVKTYDYLFITDISVTDETIEVLNNSIYKDSYFIIDHHDTRKEIHNNKNIFVLINDNKGVPNSGTNLFADFIYCNFNFEFESSTHNFIDMVRLFDTWLWKKDKVMTPIKLNHLFGYYKYIEFVKKMSTRLEKNEFQLFTMEEEKIIEGIMNKIQYYYDSLKYYIHYGANYNIAYCVMEEYLSLVADMFLDEHDNVDFLVILNLKKGFGSIRSQNENIHVGDIATLLGGGGHQLASGFTITDDLNEEIMGEIHRIFVERTKLEV
jgi:oligoribonuclease NrnB/cAMP/cGMP phosphodiesterase (DHH superfamily)